MSDSVREHLSADIKSAMRARDTAQLTVLRMLSAAIKQREVDERVTLGEADVIALVDKLIKQRKDAAQQFADGGRDDLADAERAEIEILGRYLPQALSADEVDAAITAAIASIASTGASGLADMGKVMAVLKPQLAGRADMGEASKQVRAQLSR
ncbi:MAG: GatB/YqeY domain-containing protein [Oceanococcaceae bacterium]